MASVASSSSSSQPPLLPRHARVRFSLNFRCDFGQELAVVGSHCGWEPSAATPLSWNEGDWWSGEVELPLRQRGSGVSGGGEGAAAGEAEASSPAPAPARSLPPPVDFEYKYIVRQGQHAAAWQPDSNFALRLGPIERREDCGDGGSSSSSSTSSDRQQQQQQQQQQEREQQKRSLEGCLLLLPSRVEVGDSWDGAVHDVTPVEVVEIALGPAPAGVSPAAAAEELQAALSAAVSALDERRISPASREALDADARVADAAARASAAAAAAAAVSKRRTTPKRGLLRE